MAETIVEWVETILYPQLRERYTFRKAHGRYSWYVCPKVNITRTYGLIWDETLAKFRITSIGIDSLESERRELEAEVSKYADH